MNQQETILAPAEDLKLAVKEMYGIEGEKGFEVLRQNEIWCRRTNFEFDREQIKCLIREIMDEKENNFLISQLITFDLVLTSIGGLFSVFIVMFGFITSQGFLIFAGVCGIIPVIIHITDGINRRWTKIINKV